MLRKYVSNPIHILLVQDVNVREDITYGKEPVAIVDIQTRRLRNKVMAMAKVQWHRHNLEECT